MLYDKISYGKNILLRNLLVLPKRLNECDFHSAALFIYIIFLKCQKTAEKVYCFKIDLWQYSAISLRRRTATTGVCVRIVLREKAVTSQKSSPTFRTPVREVERDLF